MDACQVCEGHKGIHPYGKPSPVIYYQKFFGREGWSIHKKYDYVVFGSGMFGMYAAKLLAERGMTVAIVEKESTSFSQASSINQARVHHGYHYPRSIATAMKCAQYYRRFCEDFPFALHRRFRKIYAVAQRNSMVSAAHFKRFCRYLNIPAGEVDSSLYFNPGWIEGAFATEEASFDARKIKEWFLDCFRGQQRVDLFYGMELSGVDPAGDDYVLHFHDRPLRLRAGGVINASYSSINHLLSLFGFDPMKLKYELCEIALVHPSRPLQPLGITIMDGPFLSIMPFGLSGMHSVYSVDYSPHISSNGKLPTFECQSSSARCTPSSLDHCNGCPVRPNTAWRFMNQQRKLFLKEELGMEYTSSLFVVRTVPLLAEVDDTRPTIVKTFREQPKFISVLSGKINTIYDLEEVLPT